MKLLFFSQFYLPESIASAFRATENAQIWAKNNEVTVFTGYPNYPTGKIYNGYTPKLLSEENVNNVRVLRSKLIAKPNKNMINRLENALSYYFFGLVNVFFNSNYIGKDYDIVLGTSGIVFNALLAKQYAKKIKKPFVVEFRDLTYKQMIATGKSEKNITVRVMRWLELKLCKNAKKVVTVTKGFKEILESEGIPAEKIIVITNGVEANLRQDRTSEGIRIGYFGTLGISQNIEDTFKYSDTIASRCKDFEYLIIGEGAQKTLLQAKAKSKPYIRMMDGMPQDELEPYYDEIDLAVITLRKSASFKYTIPSKLFQCMGRGVPVLFVGPEGETAGIIRDANAGITLTGTQEEDIVNLNEFFDGTEKEKLKKMGINGYQCTKDYYSRSKLAKVYMESLLDV